MKKKLRIGVFVTSQQPHPAPPGVIWAPIDLAIEIADELKPKGCAFTFYAPPSPKLARRHKIVFGKMNYGVNTQKFLKYETRYKRVHAGPRVVTMHDQYLLWKLIEDANRGKYDVIHAHMVERTLPMIQFCKVPVLITLHDPIWPLTAQTLQLYVSPKMHLVSISNSQRKPAPNLKYAATVYNGIDTSLFDFNDEPEDFFLSVGRIIPQKGVPDAIKAAKLAKARLKIVGKYYDKTYFKKFIKKELTKKVTYHRQVPRETLPKLYRRAKALLMPIKWEEPFGLVMAEAMACGTPVIAYGRGSVPEVVKDGKTGYIVRNAREMARAIKKIDEIKRHACRKHVEKHFSLKRMSEQYEKLYRRFSR